MTLRRSLISTAAALCLLAPAASAQEEMDTLTMVQGVDLNDWDPAVIYSSEIAVLLNIYETLTRLDPATGKAAPLLAKEWKVSDDGLTWTFTLRDDVQFSDGTPFDAEAARAALTRTIEMGKGASYIWSGVDTVEAPDSTTLVVNTSNPMPLDLIAASQYAAFMYSPKAAEDGFEEGETLGTGPYRLVRYDRSQQLVLEQNENYWRDWSPEKFERVIVRFVQESSTQTQMLRSAEADILLSTPPSDLLDRLKEEEGLEVSVFDSWLNLPLMINTDKYPTDNLKFRQALTHLMDYKAMANDIYAGYGSVADSCIPESIFGAGSFDLPRYDLEAARKLLEESGVPKEDWKVKYFTYSGRQEIAQAGELFQALAAQAGVEVELETGEWGVMWDKQKSAETAANMFAVFWFADWPSPTGWLKTIWHTEDPIVWNFSHYSNPAYDKLIDEAIALQGSDRDAASDLFVEAQQVLHDEAVVMCLVDIKKAILHRSDLQGVDYNPAYETVFAYDLTKQD